MKTEMINKKPLTYQGSYNYTNRKNEKCEIILLRSDRQVALNDLVLEFNKQAQL